MKHRFLIAQYFPGQGETVDEPRCYCGTGSYILPAPLPEYIKADLCYKSQQQAQRYAAKLNMLSMSARHTVIEVLV